MQELDMDHSPVGVTRQTMRRLLGRPRQLQPADEPLVRLLAVHRLSRCDLPCHAASLNSGNHCHGSTPLLGPEPLESDKADTVLRASPLLHSAHLWYEYK